MTESEDAAADVPKKVDLAAALATFDRASRSATTQSELGTGIGTDLSAPHRTQRD
jgi:hypothetical protein